MQIIPSPTGKYDDVDVERLFEACGFIPPWVAEAFVTTPNDVRGKVMELYGFGTGTFDGFTVEENGVMTYPDDPPQHPLIVMVPEGEHEGGGEGDEVVHAVYMYEHAWVNFVHKGPDGQNVFNIVRMD